MVNHAKNDSELIQRLTAKYPERDLEFVMAAKIGFVLSLAFSLGEKNDEDQVVLAVHEHVAQQASLMDLSDAGEAEEVIEVNDLNTGENLWPEPAAPGEKKPRFCPHCGAQTLEKDVDGFVEMGQYDGKAYPVEGDGIGYRCTSCGESFLDFSINDADREAIKASDEENH